MLTTSDLILFLHLFAEGRIDRLDAAILVERVKHPGVGYKSIAKAVSAPVRTVRRRIRRHGTLFCPEPQANADIPAQHAAP